MATTPPPNHVERAHCELSPSASHRWIHCPGSVRLSRGLPRTENPHALEGTAAHDLAERCLRGGIEPITFLGTSIEGVEVTEEMCDGVGVYLEFCRRSLNNPRRWNCLIEHRFSLAALNPPDVMYGTADFVGIGKKTGELQVVDFKYGKGVVVSPKNNSQMLMYALGARQQHPDADNIYLTIVQPRAEHPDGPIRTWHCTKAELDAFQDQLMASARETLPADAPLIPGAQCRFCPALPQCPAVRSQAMELAQREFGQPELPDLALVSIPDLARTLPKLDAIEHWAVAVRAKCFAELRSGREVPGQKLVAKRPTRKWRNVAAAAAWALKESAGELDNELFVQELKSPPQIEKILGEIPEELVVKESSGPTMVREVDPRPSYQPSIAAADDFPLMLED